MIEGQMGFQPLNGNDARALLRIVWQWIENANDGHSSDVGDLIHNLEEAGYGPLEEGAMSENEDTTLWMPTPEEAAKPTVRGVIANALYSSAKWQPDEVNYWLDALLREHAHELAEKIRAEKILNPDGEVEEHVNYVIDNLADLIDPEVET